MTLSFLKSNNDFPLRGHSENGIPQDIFNIICDYHYNDFKQIFNKIVPTLNYPTFFLANNGLYYLQELRNTAEVEWSLYDNELYFDMCLDPEEFTQDFESHEILLSLHSCHCHDPTGLDQKTIINNNMIRLIKRQSTIKAYDILLFLKLINYNPAEICDHRFLEGFASRPLPNNNDLMYYEMFFGS